MLRLSDESNLGPPALHCTAGEYSMKEPFERPYLVAIRDLTCAATKHPLLKSSGPIRPCLAELPKLRPVRRKIMHLRFC